MARPDCDDGWIKISVELEAALDFADFTKMGRTILRYAFLQIFGGGRRPAHALISPTEIAGRIGRSKQLVSRGLQELTASGVLAAVDGQPGAYRLVKNYERWVVARRTRNEGFEATGERLLTDREIADCKASPAYAREFARAAGKAEPAIQTVDTHVTQTVDDAPPKRLTADDGFHPNGGRSVLQTVDELSSKRLTNQAPPKNPLLGTDIQSTEKAGFALSADADSSSPKAAKEPRQIRLALAPLPANPGADDPLAAYVRQMVLNGSRSKARPDGDGDHAQRVVDLAAAWRDLNYPEAAIRDALVAAVQKGLVRKFDSLKGYAEAVLKRWAEKNRPGIQAAPTPAAARPVQYHRADPSRPRPVPPKPEPRS